MGQIVPFLNICLFLASNFHPIASFESPAKISDLELTNLLEELDTAQIEHGMIKSRLSHVQMRHNPPRTAIFSAIGRVNGQECGPHTITNWVNQVNLRPKGVTTGGFNSGTYNVPVDGIYYITACFRCRQGTFCDVELRVNGVHTNALGRRDNSRDSWGSFCQMALLNLRAGDDVNLYMASGASSDCLEDKAVPYSSFNGWLMVAT